MPTESKLYELTATLDVPGATLDLLDQAAADLERALVAEIRDYPAITAYFVSSDHEAGEIQLGLRFDGIDPAFIQGVADEVLDSVIDQAAKASPSDLSAVREGSMLVPV